MTSQPAPGPLQHAMDRLDREASGISAEQEAVARAEFDATTRGERTQAYAQLKSRVNAVIQKMDFHFSAPLWNGASSVLVTEPETVQQEDGVKICYEFRQVAGEYTTLSWIERRSPAVQGYANLTESMFVDGWSGWGAFSRRAAAIKRFEAALDLLEARFGLRRAGGPGPNVVE